TAVPDNSASISNYRYAFPIIRLADLYLLYSESLNEWKETPDPDVYQYIDLVPARSGLQGVVESSANHSIQPDKPLSREGMREIIQRERMNELAFEGVRVWALRRCKPIQTYIHNPVDGVELNEDTVEHIQRSEHSAELKSESKEKP